MLLLCYRDAAAAAAAAAAADAAAAAAAVAAAAAAAAADVYVANTRARACFHLVGNPSQPTNQPAAAAGESSS